MKGFAPHQDPKEQIRFRGVLLKYSEDPRHWECLDTCLAIKFLTAPMLSSVQLSKGM